MKTITTIIISICALALLSTISGVAYSVFCDTEMSHNNTMTVSTRYYNPVPGPIVLDACINMVKWNNRSENNPQGKFCYNSSNYRFFYNLSVDVQDAGSNHTWMLVAHHNATTFYLLNSGKTDGLQDPDKHLVMNGSIDLNTDLDAQIILFEDHYWNATYLDMHDLGVDDLGHCLRSFGWICYHDTYQFS